MAEGGDPNTQQAADAQQEQLLTLTNFPEIPKREEIAQLPQISPSVWRAFLEKKECKMTVQQKDHLLQSQMDFVQTLDVSDIIDYLFADGVLTGQEQEEILNCRHQKSNVSAIRELMNIVNRKDQKAFYSLLRAIHISKAKLGGREGLTTATAPEKSSTEGMEQTGVRCFHLQEQESCITAFSEELYKILPYQEGRATHADDEAWRHLLSQHQGDMNPQHQRLLRYYNVTLVNTLDPKCILPFLEQDGIVNRELVSVIQHQKSRQDGVREMLRVIRMKGQQGFLSLCRAMVTCQRPSQSPYSEMMKKEHKVRIAAEVERTKLGTIESYTKLSLQLNQEGRRERRKAYNVLEIESPKDKATPILPDEMFMAKPEWNDSQNPKIICVIGKAGIGKTTLLRKLAFDWSDSKLWQGDFHYMFRYVLRTWNRRDKLSLYDLLMKHHLPANIADDQKDKAWNKITEDPSKVLIMMDGLDEFNGFKKMKGIPDICDHKEKMTYPALVYNLYKQNLLSGTSIVFTSRPRAAAFNCLNEFQRKIYIAGFDEEQIKKYIETYFKGNEQEIAWVLKWLKEHRDIISYCYIPVLLSLICQCLHQLYISEGQGSSAWHTQPQTLTQLMSLLITYFIKEHHTDIKYKKTTGKLRDILQPYKNPFRKLAGLAAKGMESEPAKLAFSEDDLKLMGIKITQEEMNFGLLTTIKDDVHPILGITEEFTQFIHLLMQEYMAACHWLRYTSRQIKECLDQVEHGHYDMVILFLFGLLGDQSFREDLQAVFPEETTAESCKEKARSLLQLLQTREMTTTKEGRLLLLMVLYQGQQPAMVKEAGQWVITKEGELDLESTHMTSVESQALGYFLQHTDCEVVKIDLERNPLGSQGIRYLCPSTQMRCASTLEQLWLGSTDLDDAGMKELVPLLKSVKLKSLWLRDNKVTGAGLGLLCKELCAEELEWLYLDDNPSLMSEGVEVLCHTLIPCCTKLQWLRLQSTGLNETWALQLTAALKQCSPQLQYLGVGGDDPISPECKQQMKQMLEDRVLIN